MKENRLATHALTRMNQEVAGSAKWMFWRGVLLGIESTVKKNLVTVEHAKNVERQAI